MIIQDFTQIKVQGTFYQDLILWWRTEAL